MYWPLRVRRAHLRGYNSNRQPSRMVREDLMATALAEGAVTVIAVDH